MAKPRTNHVLCRRQSGKADNDGDSEDVYVEAYTDAEAMEKAIRQVHNADYAMIKAVWVA